MSSNTRKLFSNDNSDDDYSYGDSSPKKSIALVFFIFYVFLEFPVKFRFRS